MTSTSGAGSGEFQSLSSKGSIYVFRDGLPGTAFDAQETRNAMVAQLRSLESCPNYWVPLDAIRSGQLRTPAERVVSDLYHRCIVPHVLADADPQRPDAKGVITGAEYWTQVYRKGRGLAFHVDKDEHAMKARGEMINPEYSSVLYLTGGEQRGIDGRLRVQSPTVVTDEHYDQERRRMVPIDFPTESCLVFPKANRYLVFDGRAGHGVLDLGRDGDGGGDGGDGDNTGDEHDEENVRVTFLVNWWTARPEGVERDLGFEDARDAAENRDNGLAPQTSARKEPVYSLIITKEYLFANEPFMMDDFLREQGILNDDNSVSPVILRHRGVVMIPFRPPDDNDHEGSAGHIVDCALISQENHSIYM